MKVFTATALPPTIGRQATTDVQSPEQEAMVKKLTFLSTVEGIAQAGDPKLPIPDFCREQLEVLGKDHASNELYEFKRRRRSAP